MTNVVYRATDTTTPVYHYYRDCSYLQNKDGRIQRVHVDKIKDRWRPCDECRYADVPTLD